VGTSVRSSGLLILALALALSLAGIAHADVGVGVDLGRITVDEKLAPGGQYRLPTLTVTNPGDTAGEYRVRVTDPGEPGWAAPPEGWFRLEPARFRLDPGAAQPVQVALELPAGAEPGQYAAYLEASPVAEGAGVQVGAAVATLVTFEVKPSSRWAAWRLQAWRVLDDHSPWPQIVAGALLLGAVAALVRRRLRIAVSIQRRR
jgi:hypothetical protein